jgi:succinate dehydrogenase / fumarate reductase cytochrome b subunit
MADTRHTAERPLSPHLSIYSLLINMVMSILHRITGGALYFGTLLLAAWLVAAASGEAAYAIVVLFGYTWALFHHMLGGLRHFLWDTGRGFQLWQVDLLSWLTIIGSVTLTLLAWGLALYFNGGL